MYNLPGYCPKVAVCHTHYIETVFCSGFRFLFCFFLALSFTIICSTSCFNFLFQINTLQPIFYFNYRFSWLVERTKTKNESSLVGKISWLWSWWTFWLFFWSRCVFIEVTFPSCFVLFQILIIWMHFAYFFSPEGQTADVLSQLLQPDFSK